MDFWNLHCHLEAILANPSHVHAAKISVVGAGEISKLTSDPSTTSVAGVSTTFSSASKQSYGLGMLLGMSVGPVIELESGLLLINRKYQLTTAANGKNQTDSYAQKAVQLPLLLRLHLGNLLSVGAGGYVAVGTGSVVDNNDGGFTGQPKTTTGTYATQSIKNKDFGVMASAAINLPIAPMVSILFDARYILDLSDVNASPTSSSPPVSHKYQDAQFLLGLQFGLR